MWRAGNQIVLMVAGEPARALRLGCDGSQNAEIRVDVDESCKEVRVEEVLGAFSGGPVSETTRPCDGYSLVEHPPLASRSAG